MIYINVGIYLDVSILVFLQQGEVDICQLRFRINIYSAIV